MPVPEDTTTPTFEPDTLHLTMAAAMLVQLDTTTHKTPGYNGHFNGAMGLWITLTGLDEAEALTWAYEIAQLYPPTTGTVIPL